MSAADKSASRLDAPSRRRFLEVSPYAEDEGALIGRDPRKIPAPDWAGVARLTAMQAVRAKCLDCAHNFAEARKCVQVDCPLWPLRMGKYPKGLAQAALASGDQDEPDDSATPEPV